MQYLILNESSSFSVTGTIIIIIGIVLAIVFRKALGRMEFGTWVLIGMVFLSIFLIDHYTSHKLRDFLDLSFYDETVEDPIGKVEELANDSLDVGGKVLEEVDKFGRDVDKDLGIERQGKAWVRKEKDEPTDEKESEDVNKDKDVDSSDKEPSIETGKIAANQYLITYAEIPDLLASDLEGLSADDKAIIDGMTPTIKITLENDRILVTNEKQEENTLLTIVVK